MAWSEHLGGNKYKIVERDPSKATRPKRSITVEMPPEIERSKSDKKKKDWLAVQESKWSDLVVSGQYEDQGKKRSKANRVTFAQFVPVWKKGYANENMSGETLYNTQKIIDSRFIPKFGDTWMNEITTLQLVEWFADLKSLKDGKPLATNSKLNIYKAAKSIFDFAHEWGVIKSNPMAGVKRPSVGKKEKKAMRSVKQSYTQSEVAKLLLALYKLPNGWRLYFTGVMMGGYRRGEFLAVEWPDVSYERSAIWIDKQISIDREGRKEEREVKTVESEGWVPMPRWYMDELKSFEREWKKEKLACPKWEGGDKQYIFHGGNGVMYYPGTATKTWSKFLKRNNLPHIKLHGLRHTAGTLLREYGADQRTIQKFLRHSKMETTDRYVHESDTISRAAIAPLEDLNPEKLKFAP